jgi:maltooligosyltrehalose trehalohydrolase
MLFMGEEWGASTPFQYFTDHQDPELGRAVSEGRRGEFASFGWDPADVPDPQDAATFERSKLDWDEVEKPPHAELLDWHRQLIALRRQHEEFADGDRSRVRVQFDESARWLLLERGPAAVAVNLNDHSQPVVVGDNRTRILAASEPDITVAGGVAQLPPDSVVVVSG